MSLSTAVTKIKPVLVVAGVGKGQGTGGSTARLFAKQGYSVALIARDSDALNTFAEEINNSGGEAAAFPLPSYTPTDIASAFTAISARFPNPQYALRVAVFNAGSRVVGPFLTITPEQLRESLAITVEAPFAFAREAISRFQSNAIEDGKRGTLLFTGATASLRGNVTTSAFAAGKFALRGLSQSLAKEFGRENIHVAQVIIDGMILTDRVREYFAHDPTWAGNEDIRIHPDSIADSYLYLVNQDRSAWTWELDLRPAHEKW